MSDFSFIDDQKPVVFTLSGVASQPGPDRLLRPLSQQQLAAFLETGFAAFFEHFARQMIEGQLALLGGLRANEGEQVLDLFRPLAAFPGVGRGYLQVPALGLDGRPGAARGEPQTIATFFLAGEQLDIRAVEIELQSGSVIAKVLAGVGGGATLAAAVFFLAQPDYTNLRQDMAWNQRIERVMDGQACVLDIGAKVNVGELRRLAVNDLRVADRGLEEAEARKRVCYTQLLLRAAGAYPGEIDGLDGPQTQKARLEFARRAGLGPRDVDRPVFFDALIDSIQRKI